MSSSRKEIQECNQQIEEVSSKKKSLGKIAKYGTINMAERCKPILTNMATKMRGIALTN